MKIALCDDDPAELASARAWLDEYFSANGIAARIEAFSCGQELLFALEDNVFDLYVLDVIMPEMDGIELGAKIRETDESGAIIYLTSSPDFAYKSYSVHAFNYLLKPVRKETLFPELDRVMDALRKRSESISVKTRDGTVRLLLDDICYAELADRAVRYHSRTGSVDGMTSSASFRTMVAPLLDDDRFYLCGASLLVNLRHIKLVDKVGALLTTGQRIKVPARVVPKLYDVWTNYWLEVDTRR